MLITYADSVGANLRELQEALRRYFGDAVGGLHVLPFFPSSGDRGFAPLCYDEVDARFGTAEDIRALGARYDLMVDFMVNHISRQSVYFQDFQRQKDASPYKDLFIRYKDFWPGGEPTQAQVDAIYKRKPRAPYYEVCFADGTKEKVWCTFGEEQIDLNVCTGASRQFFRESLGELRGMSASIIRLDAFAYAVKKPGTSCFFVKPEIWALLSFIRKTVEPYDVAILPEIHEHYTIQMELAQAGYWIYDFALPMLVLHALYSGNGEYLRNWLAVSPMRQFTTLDTHDGIGIVDVKDLLPDDQINYTEEKLYAEGTNVNKLYSSAAYNNLDIYQVNTTYYSALGNRDDAYLLARAIQFFAPGIPQVYYVGAMAGKNDIALMEKTKNGRDINRHCFTLEEIAHEVQRPVVRYLFALMRFRNRHPGFDLKGEILVELPEPSTLIITRSYKTHSAILKANLRTHTFVIQCTDAESYLDELREYCSLHWDRACLHEK